MKDLSRWGITRVRLDETTQFTCSRCRLTKQSRVIAYRGSRLCQGNPLCNACVGVIVKVGR